MIEHKGITKLVANDDELTVDLNTGIVQNNSKNTSFHVKKLPPFIIEIINDGGLIENLRRRIKK